MATGQGVGARLIRKEDDRLMRGRGQFVADLRFAGMQDVAFVRSPLAHARIRGIAIPPALRDAVFIASDLVRRQADPRRIGVARLQGLRAACARNRARRASSANWSRCASRRLVRRPRISPVPSRSTSKNFRPCMTCSRPAPRDRRCCTTIGPTMSSSRRSWMSISARHWMHRSRSRGRSGPRGNAWRRSKGAAWLRCGTRGSNSSRSIRPARCRTSSAPGCRLPRP